jgi:hypothetical protein
LPLFSPFLKGTGSGTVARVELYVHCRSNLAACSVPVWREIMHFWLVSEPASQSCFFRHNVQASAKEILRLEQKQSKRALVKNREGGFFLRKKPFEDMASGYSYSALR